MAEISEISCAIIAAVGTAKGSFVEAIRYARSGQLSQAREAYEEGVANFHIGHEAHKELLTRFAQGEKLETDILLVHAQCQMMSAEDFMVLSRELLDYIEEKESQS